MYNALTVKKALSRGTRKIHDLTERIQFLNNKSNDQKRELDELTNALNETKRLLHDATSRHETEILQQKLSLIEQQKAIKELKGRGVIWNLLLYFTKLPLLPISILVILLGRKYKTSLIMIIVILYFQKKI